MLKLHDYLVLFFFKIICNFIIISTIEAQSNNTSIPAELEKISYGVQSPDTIVNYVYNIKNNPLDATKPGENFFVSITTCKAPSPNLPEISPARQLEVWISTKIKNPGPKIGGDNHVLTNGSLSVPITNENNGIYIGVYAPKLSKSYSNSSYYFQIGASTKGFIHQVPKEKGLLLDDTDNFSALFRTSYTKTKPSYNTYLVNYTLVNGISMSFCAYESNNLIQNEGNNNLIPKSEVTTRESDGGYQSLIYVGNLSRSTGYYTLVTENSNDGFKLFMPVTFQTQSESNCGIIKNLEFCDKIFYSAPNPVPDQIKGYDDLAEQYFNNFTLTVDQYPCNISKYSLVRDCNDCKAAYKDWICAITIPRCANEFLNETGSVRGKSRVDVNQSMEINQPFNELPPCIDLCYNVVRSCPAIFGFSCPNLNSIDSVTYGGPISINSTDVPICNSMGKGFSSKLNVAVGIWSSTQWIWTLIISVTFTIIAVGL